MNEIGQSVECLAIVYNALYGVPYTVQIFYRIPLYSTECLAAFLGNL